MDRSVRYLGVMLVALFGVSAIYAQTKEDQDRVVVTPVVSQYMKGYNRSVARLLRSKLNGIVTAQGVGGGGLFSRFVLTANVHVLDKEVLPTAPPRIAQKVEVTFLLGDGVDGNLYATTSKVYKGIGRNETKAYTQALKYIQGHDEIFTRFLAEGKQKIIIFYKEHSDLVFKEVDQLVARKRYEAAVARLEEIPKVCSAVYEKAQERIVFIDKQQKNEVAEQCLSKAQMAVSQHRWQEANGLLYGIPKEADCYEQSRKLLDEIEDEIDGEALQNAKQAMATGSWDSASKWIYSILPSSKYYAEALTLAKTAKEGMSSSALKCAEAALASEDFEKVQFWIAKIMSGTVAANESKHLIEEMKQQKGEIAERDAKAEAGALERQQIELKKMLYASKHDISNSDPLNRQDASKIKDLKYQLEKWFDQ
ncbi:hypothetical protein K4L44_04960 [Halosquirtibacter laminarini]|uniref:Uncharacterized protein n=1 Tax=Halosquirtibacter laminarini TaxID=3374600 RepID=A0AC61NHP8_9BACT|nr:hypothetical protein K4L44_04960 [Prolixibacteraceae bacterium]